jgi:MinD-like ATPase involved in chromosome partitioning or flagellar assembly
LADLFSGIDAHRHDVLVDLGRGGAFGASQVLAARADAVVLVVRGTMRSVHAAQSRVAMLRRLLEAEDGRGSSGLCVLLVKQGPYGRQEVQKALGVPVIAALPFRTEEAAVLSDGAPEDRRFAHGELMRAARQVVADLQQFAAGRARVQSGIQRRLSDPRWGVARHAG